jgi:hypothetical protein
VHHSITFGPRRISKSGWRQVLSMLFILGLGGMVPSRSDGQNQVVLDVVDSESGKGVPARVEFTRSGKKLKRDRKTLTSGDTWLAEGSLPIQPPPGDYEFLVQRGPEFNTIRGGFTVERGSRDTVLIEVPRSIDMHDEGWYSGDLGSELPAEQLARWQRADAIDMAIHTSLRSTSSSDPSPTKKDIKQIDAPKFETVSEVGHGWLGASVEYRSSSMALALHRLPSGFEPPIDPYEALESLEQDPHALAEITQLAAGDLPILMAHPKVRCARLLNFANRHERDAVLELDRKAGDDLFAKLSLDLGKNRWSIPVLAPFPDKDQIRFRGPDGAGLLSEAIYWLALEAGMRLAPTAASGFGFGDTHLGYNRVYAYCDVPPTPEAWWHAIERGESFITNGPLLRAMINEVPPGTVRAGYASEPIPLSIAVSLAVRDEVDYVDVIFNGESLYNAKLEDHYRNGEFPLLEITTSGWLVIRVVTANESGYRLATTAPFYFELDDRKRIQRKGVEFFQEWLERVERSTDSQANDSLARQRAVERAKVFWKERFAESD